MTYSFYVVDTETTGLDPFKNDVIELSILRISDSVQKTFFIKPINIENINLESLKINGHLYDDLLHKTSVGRGKYKDPKEVIVEVENFLMEEGTPIFKRSLIGQNVLFDKMFLEQLWNKCDSSDSFPFGRRYLDTMQIELFNDFIKNDLQESYSLSAILKRHKLKNAKAHSAHEDVKATTALFFKQVTAATKPLGGQDVVQY